MTEKGQHGFTHAILGLSNLVVLCGKVTEFVDEGKAMDIIYTSTAFSVVSNSTPASRLVCYSQDGEKKPGQTDRLQGLNGSNSAWRPVISRIP